MLKGINQHTWNNRVKMMYRYGTPNHCSEFGANTALDRF